jgi:hypothetical protein
MDFGAIWALVAAMVLPMQALAWGPEGHSIVAELAPSIGSRHGPQRRWSASLRVRTIGRCY